MYSKIRSAFLNFFERNDHKILQSSSVVPNNDPTLMFTNSGMVQFKNVFLGLESPIYKNIATAQKSLRAGGKHNDLDNVGYTNRHNTFFEMLGNFSFTDYFKEKAILLAWEFLHKELSLKKEKIFTTVFYNDEEAFDIWKKVLGSSDHIIKINTNDNFWSMGDSGPCGPCSEIFYDYGDKMFGDKPGTKDQDGPRFTEIWNLVFMQFNKEIGKDLMSLNQKAIDTGMSLERLVSVIEGKTDNYETSLFLNIRKGIGKIYGFNPFKEKDNITASRVVSDHVRAACFMIADGITPSNEGRGYVLRRIMRRAMRYLHNISPESTKMHLLPELVDKEMGEVYSELRNALPIISSVIKTEEDGFKQMLYRGLMILEREIKSLSSNVISGSIAFKLYDTYGFPLDLTQDILRQKNIFLDTKEFDFLLEQQKRLSKQSHKCNGDITDDKVWFDIKEKYGDTKFLGYEQNICEAKVIAKVDDWAVFDQTVCYAESGGQIGSIGLVIDKNTDVTDSEKYRGWYIKDTRKFANGVYGHKLENEIMDKAIEIDDIIIVKNDVNHRNQIEAHHTATHLLHYVLKLVVGNHIMQKGSKVTNKNLTFDFNHSKSLTKEEIREIEEIINKIIQKRIDVKVENILKEEALSRGAIALFGEKYGDTVRVITIDDNYLSKSIELCGGTHVQNTGFIGGFKIFSESSIGSGIRRIEARCGYLMLLSLEEKIKEQAYEISHLKGSLEKIIKIQDKLRVQISVSETKIINDFIIVEQMFEAQIMREVVMNLKNKYNDKIILSVSKNQNGATYIIDMCKNADFQKAKMLAINLQEAINVKQIRNFEGKMLIFGGNLIDYKKYLN